MKKNEKTLQASMDRRLSFLDDLPSCRAAVRYRIAQEEEPVMKKKISLGFVFAMGLMLLSVAALATGLLISPRVTASRIADQALEKTYGITAEMQTFFFRQEEELEDGAVQVTYTGVGSLDDVLGTYTALVRDGKAEIVWSHDGKDTSGGYNAEVWGLDQLRQMMQDSLDEKSKTAFLTRAAEIANAHSTGEDEPEEELTAEAVDAYFAQLEAEKTAAMEACKLSEDEMIGIGREFILNNYGLNEEQIGRMELYTNSFDTEDNTWYTMINGKPCFLVEYLLYEPYTTAQMESGEPWGRSEMDGYYIVHVNVETGEVENYEYNSALAGEG